MIARYLIPVALPILCATVTREASAQSLSSSPATIQQSGDEFAVGFGEDGTRMEDFLDFASAGLGKQIFYDATDPRMNEDGYLSCASCHLDGGQDGRVRSSPGEIGRREFQKKSPSGPTRRERENGFRS